MRLIQDFNSIPSLSLITASYVAVTIWNRRDIGRFINIYVNNDESYRTWNRIEDNVTTIVQSLHYIPLTLKEGIKAIIKPIGRHVRAMRAFIHFSPLTRNADFELPVIYRTYYGTVDTTRHEKELAQDERNDIVLRYNLACNDCFKEIIEEQFSLLTDVQKNNFLRVERNRELLSYWTNCKVNNLTSFKEEFSGSTRYSRVLSYSAHQFAFAYTLLNGSKSGIEYFLNFLSPKDYEFVLNNHGNVFFQESIHSGDFPDGLKQRRYEQFEDALYFLLSKLSPNQRMQILSKYPFKILGCFLKYPFFGLFNKYATILMDKLLWEEVSSLLHTIYIFEQINIHMFGLELFDDFWLNCPEIYKANIRGYEEGRGCSNVGGLNPFIQRIATAELNRLSL